MAVLRLLCVQSVASTVAAINSAPHTLAIHQEESILDDDVALLQEKTSIKKQQPEESEAPEMLMDLISNIHEPPFGVTEHSFDFGSYISEDYLQCVQGPWGDIGMHLGIGRATPWSLLYNSHPTLGATCEDQGYTELLQQEDECHPESSRWARPGSPAARTQAGVPTGGLWGKAFDDYDNSNHYEVGTTRRWVACGTCFQPSSALRVEWDVDCDGWVDDTLAAMRADDIPNGFRSIVPVGGEVCFEGQTDYLQRVIANARATPLAEVFEGSDFSTESCTDRGFDVTRDMQDECWPLARKHMKHETEDIDMINWIGRYATALNSPTPESSGGLWTTQDWISCACEPGGAVRDRGMWQTMDGINSAPYTAAYCDAMNFPTN